MAIKLRGLNELYRRIYLLHLKRPEILQERYGMTPQELEDAKTDFFDRFRSLRFLAAKHMRVGLQG